MRNQKWECGSQRQRDLIDDAVKTAETTKKGALLEVKEESIKTKNELEESQENVVRNCSAMKECWQKKLLIKGRGDRAA